MVPQAPPAPPARIAGRSASSWATSRHSARSIALTLTASSRTTAQPSSTSTRTTWAAPQDSSGPRPRAWRRHRRGRRAPAPRRCGRPAPARRRAHGPRPGTAGGRARTARSRCGGRSGCHAKPNDRPPERPPGRCIRIGSRYHEARHRAVSLVRRRYAVPVRSRCLQPGQQQGRRMPSDSSSCVRRMRRSRVDGCFASSTQQMNSLRASGVMSVQAASTSRSALNASRRSAGSRCTCTTPSGTWATLMWAATRRRCAEDGATFGA